MMEDGEVLPEAAEDAAPLSSARLLSDRLVCSYDDVELPG